MIGTERVGGERAGAPGTRDQGPMDQGEGWGTCKVSLWHYHDQYLQNILLN